MTRTGKILTEPQALWWQRVYYATTERPLKELVDISEDGNYALLHIKGSGGWNGCGNPEYYAPARWEIVTFTKPKGFGKPEVVWSIALGKGKLKPAMLMRFAEFGLRAK